MTSFIAVLRISAVPSISRRNCKSAMPFKSVSQIISRSSSVLICARVRFSVNPNIRIVRKIESWPPLWILGRKCGQKNGLNLSEDFFWSAPKSGQKSGLILSEDLFFDLHYSQFLGQSFSKILRTLVDISLANKYSIYSSSGTTCLCGLV